MHTIKFNEMINVFINRPQIVYLTFDDGMTEEFDRLYFSELFMPNENGEYKYTNPNGCPIKATFFVCAKSNEFQRVGTHSSILVGPDPHELPLERD